MLRLCLLAGALGLAPWLDARHSPSPPTAPSLIMSSNTVSPAAPSTTVSAYAAWDQPGPAGKPPKFRLLRRPLRPRRGRGRVHGREPDPRHEPAQQPGHAVRLPRERRGHRAGRHSPFPLALPDNPILLAEYTWTTTSFARRSVELVTENTAIFAVVPWPGGLRINLVPLGEFTPGAGSISVVPAAPTLTLLGATACLAITRRRTRSGDPS